MATTEKTIITSLNTIVTDIVNPILEPTVNYSNLVEVKLNSVAYDYTGTTINKFIGNNSYKNSYITNYTDFQKIQP